MVFRACRKRIVAPVPEPCGAARESSAALVIDRHRGLVGARVLNVVDRNEIAEDHPRIRVRLFDGRAREPDERCIRQCTAQIVGPFIHLAPLGRNHQ